MLPKKEFLNFPFVLIIGFIILISGYLLFFTGIIDIKAAAGDLITSFGTNGAVTSNPSSYNYGDISKSIAIDSTYMYVVGHDMSPGDGNYQWRIEKRNLSNGALVTSFDGDGIVTSNPSSNNEIAYSIAIDSTYMYVVGYGGILGSNVQWHIQKRNLSNGALVTSFDGDGIVTSNPSSYQDVAHSIAIDSTYMYVVGYDQSSGDGNSQWHIEKRNLSNGALVEVVFGSSSAMAYSIAIDSNYMYVAGYESLVSPQWHIEKRNLSNGALVTSFDGDGMVVSSSNAMAYSVAIDSTYMYVAGYDRSLISGSYQWRIEKRNLSNGALVTSFDGDGIVTSDPSPNSDIANSITLDSSGIYAAGYDSSPGSNNYQWRIEKRSNATTCTGSISISWTDPTITANSTKIRKVHIDELRSWIDNRRTDAGLSNYSWADSTITVNSTKIRKTHFDEMRSAISDVYTTCGQSAPSWTDSIITANSTKIRKVHMDELRSAVSSAP